MDNFYNALAVWEFELNLFHLGQIMLERLSLFALFFHLHSVTSVNVTIPSAAGASTPVVSPSLFSLSIEMDRWVDWVGSTSRNEFFFNTLENLDRLTGEPPQIRIGGNTEDKTSFEASAQFAENIFPDPTAVTPYPEASKVIIGNSYYATTRFLPPRTRVTWGLNLGANNATTAYLQAQAIAKVFTLPEIKRAGIVLDYIEIGNEPDLYKNNGLRPSNYTVDQWVNEWLAFAGNVSGILGINENSHTKFLGASFAGSSHSTNGFSPQAAFQSGLLDGAGKFISTISQHRYSGSFCAGSGGLLQDLMTKSSIRGNLTVFVPDIQATFAQGRDYILGETNSYACHGAPGVSNTAGASLWALDYALYATQLQISTVVFHDGIGFKYNFIQPAPLPRSILDATPLPEPLAPHVQPLYYAAIIAGEAIGKSGHTQVAELNIDNSRIAGYAFYEHGRVVRAVFINSQAYLADSTARGTVHLDLGFSGGSSRPSFAFAKRLSIGHATDDSGLTTRLLMVALMGFLALRRLTFQGALIFRIQKPFCYSLFEASKVPDS